MQMLFRQQRPNNHPNQGAAEDQREHKEREQKIVHSWDLSAILAAVRYGVVRPSDPINR
jgi:hypothetical protein